MIIIKGDNDCWLLIVLVFFPALHRGRSTAETHETTDVPHVRRVRRARDFLRAAEIVDGHFLVATEGCSPKTGGWFWYLGTPQLASKVMMIFFVHKPKFLKYNWKK